MKNQPKRMRITEKKNWKLKKSPKQNPNPATKPEKTWQKVAETAKIPKTAPKTQP